VILIVGLLLPQVQSFVRFFHEIGSIKTDEITLGMRYRKCPY